MFRFEHSEHLYALLLLPLPALLFVLARVAGRRAMQRFGSVQLLEKLMPGRSRAKPVSKLILWLLAIALLIIAWANPQLGTKREAVKGKGIDLFIALDVSQSMMAQDVVPSRLERAQRFARELSGNLRGNRLGLILLAGNAYLQVPLTTDYAAVELFLSSANPGMIPNQGTAIGDAIDLANRSFPADNKNHKALVVITDGEDHEAEARRAAREARSEGLILFTVGVGTAEGSFIPVDMDGQQDYKRDETGAPVRSRLDEALLRDIARTGNGTYFNLSSGPESILEALRTQIDRIEKREMEQRVFSEYESYFQVFIGIALLLLIAEFFLSNRRSKWLEGRDIFAG